MSISKARWQGEHPTWQGSIGKNSDNQTMNYLVEISYLAPQKLVEDCA
jgi:hypothetical protein